MISCYASTTKGLKAIELEDNMFLALVKSLRSKDSETIHTLKETMVIDGIYIPSKSNPAKIIMIQGDKKI